MAERWRRAQAEVTSYPLGQSAPTPGLEDELYRKHAIAPIVLGPARQKQSVEKEYEIVGDYGQRGQSSAFLLSLGVPFTGDKDLLWCIPNPTQGNPPQFLVADSELIFQLHNKDKFNPDRVGAIFKHALAELDAWLTLPNLEAEKFNRGLKSQLPKWLSDRKKTLDDNAALMAALPFPLEKAVPPVPLAVPLERKIIEVPTTATSESERECFLKEAHYRDILNTLALMSGVMERSPRAFYKIDEESLRFFFLVWLNANYKRQATAETFNVGGKTDILITVEEKTVFIGECKFWSGAKSLTAAIDQILSYACWRDTKTAILLFVRKGKFSEVIEKIAPTVGNHRNFVKNLDLTKQNEKSFLLHGKRDDGQQFTLTVVAFDVPRFPQTRPKVE